MKELKFKFDLDAKVAIYVPSTTNVTEQADNSAMVEHVLRRLSEMFGGATATDAVGGWVSQTSGLVTERVTIVYSFCRKAAFVDHLEDVLALCGKIKDEMGQEAVTLEYNGQVKFI